MKKLVFSIFIFAFITVASASEIFACTCLRIDDNKSLKKLVDEAFKESTAVFSGEVLEVTKEPEAFSVKVRFKVENSWKEKLSKGVTITTGSDSALCGYNFEVRKKYLVYTFGKRNGLKTNICTRTSALDSNKDIAVLKKIKKPKIKFSPK